MGDLKAVDTLFPLLLKEWKQSWVEATNSEGEMFSQVRLEQALNRYADLPVKKLRDKIIEEVMSFQEKQADDITLVVVKR